MMALAKLAPAFLLLTTSSACVVGYRYRTVPVYQPVPVYEPAPVATPAPPPPPVQTYAGYVESSYAYYGVHPVVDTYGGGWCFLEHNHLHEYAPTSTVNFVYRNNTYSYIGPRVFWYVDFHPLPHGGNCGLHGRHSHDFGPGRYARDYGWDRRRQAYLHHAAAPRGFPGPAARPAAPPPPAYRPSAPPPGRAFPPMGGVARPFPPPGRGLPPPGHGPGPGRGDGPGPGRGDGPKPGHGPGPGRGIWGGDPARSVQRPMPQFPGRPLNATPPKPLQAPPPKNLGQPGGPHHLRMVDHAQPTPSPGQLQRPPPQPQQARSPKPPAPPQAPVFTRSNPRFGGPGLPSAGPAPQGGFARPSNGRGVKLSPAPSGAPSGPFRGFPPGGGVRRPGGFPH